MKIPLMIDVFRHALQNLGALQTFVRIGATVRLLTELKTTQTLRGFTAEEANLEAIILEFHRCFNAS